MDFEKPTVRKAVFPVAGLGTRFLPATKASPKEMLSVANKPLIQYAVEEAYAAGIRQMIFVTCHNKSSIEDHFDLASDLETELASHDKMELLSIVQAVTPQDMECCYVRQARPLGLGNAILCAEHLVGEEPFAVLLADDLLVSNKPVLSQMLEVFANQGGNVLAVQEVSMEVTSQYGIIKGRPQGDSLMRVDDLVEKPQRDLAPSNIGIVGRYILSPGIFAEIKALPKKELCEVQLTDAIKGLIGKEPVLAYSYQGDRYDCGTLLGFLKANVVLGKAHPVDGEQFSQWLSTTQTQ
ncbi:MAG: UTP--glucose-1-phosphate uridylyltransferase GalU [Legionellales bacterium]